MNRARSKTPGAVPNEGLFVDTFTPLPPKNSQDRIKMGKAIPNVYGQERSKGIAGALGEDEDANRPTQQINQSSSRASNNRSAAPKLKLNSSVSSTNRPNKQRKEVDPRSKGFSNRQAHPHPYPATTQSTGIMNNRSGATNQENANPPPQRGTVPIPTSGLQLQSPTRQSVKDEDFLDDQVSYSQERQRVFFEDECDDQPDIPPPATVIRKEKERQPPQAITITNKQAPFVKAGQKRGSSKSYEMSEFTTKTPNPKRAKTPTHLYTTPRSFAMHMHEDDGMNVPIQQQHRATSRPGPTQINRNKQQQQRSFSRPGPTQAVHTEVQQQNRATSRPTGTSTQAQVNHQGKQQQCAPIRSCPGPARTVQAEQSSSQQAPMRPEPLPTRNNELAELLDDQPSTSAASAGLTNTTAASWFEQQIGLTAEIAHHFAEVGKLVSHLDITEEQLHAFVNESEKWIKLAHTHNQR